MWSTYRKYDEAFAGLEDYLQGGKYNIKAKRKNPLTAFFALEDEVSMLFKASARLPRILFSALISATSPKSLPTFEYYRAKINPYATEEEYYTWLTQA